MTFIIMNCFPLQLFYLFHDMFVKSNSNVFACRRKFRSFFLRTGIIYSMIFQNPGINHDPDTFYVWKGVY